MKTCTDNILPTYQTLGTVLRINFNEKILTRQDKVGVESIYYEYDTAILDVPANRGKIIEAIIACKYSYAEEISIINNQVAKPDKYQEYQEFRALAKTLADAVI